MTSTAQPSQLPTTMQAVTCYGPEDYRLEEATVPVPGPGEALVKVEAVGICASDLKCYHGAAKFWGDADRPAYVETPVTPGHEFVGTVVQLDDAAAGRWQTAVGDRVVAEQIVPCWTCRYCLSGAYHMCGPHDIFGFKRRTPGAMAEYMIYPADALVHQVSADLPAAHAAFAEPLSCALHGVERADITFDDVVVVAGCGPIGLGMIAGAKAKSARLVVALDMSPAKLAVGSGVRRRRDHRHRRRGHGREDQGTDRRLRRRCLPGGQSGHPSAVGQGLNLLRKLGRYVEYSVFGSDVSVDWSIISDDKELDVRGAHLGPHCWPAAIKMLESGLLPMDRICTHQLPLEQFQDGLDLVSAGDRSVKVTLIP